MLAALALAASLLPLLASGLCVNYPCCNTCNAENTTYAACTCLLEGAAPLAHNLSSGQTLNYHWRLTDWSMAEDDNRNVTFVLTPCFGQARLLVNAVPDTFATSATDARWSTVHSGFEARMSIDLYTEQFFVSVLASTDAGYKIAAYTHRACRDREHVCIVPDITPPQPALCSPHCAAGDHILTAPTSNVTVAPTATDEILLEGDPMSMTVSFTTGVCGLLGAFTLPAHSRVHATGPPLLPCARRRRRRTCMLTTPHRPCPPLPTNLQPRSRA